MKVGLRRLFAGLVCLVPALMISGCGGSGSSSTPPTVSYAGGTFAGTISDSSNVFGQGTQQETLNYTDSPSGVDSGSYTGAGTISYPTVVYVSTGVTLEPSSIIITIQETGLGVNGNAGPNPPKIVAQLNPQSTAGQYSGAGGEFVYNPTTQQYEQKGSLAPITITYQSPTTTPAVRR
ncbi:MAG: hypothetical protein ACLQVD_19325 [Capsulimonadaceae bacterium]